MAAPLTLKQTEIYDFILQYTRQYGYPPSVREIGFAVNLKSPSTVHFHMKKLEAEGYIQKADGKTRAISLPREAVAEELDSHENRVPVLGDVAAGSPILAREQVEEYLTFDTGGLTGEHFALKVRGGIHALRRYSPRRPGGGPPAGDLPGGRYRGGPF